MHVMRKLLKSNLVVSIERATNHSQNYKCIKVRESGQSVKMSNLIEAVNEKTSQNEC